MKHCFQRILKTFFFLMCLMALKFSLGTAMGLCAFEDMIASRRLSSSFSESTSIKSGLVKTANTITGDIPDNTLIKEYRYTTTDSNSFAKDNSSTSYSYNTDENEILLKSAVNNATPTITVISENTLIKEQHYTTKNSRSFAKETINADTEDQTTTALSTTDIRFNTDITAIDPKLTKTKIRTTTYDQTSTESNNFVGKVTTSGFRGTTTDHLTSEIYTLEGQTTFQDIDTTTSIPTSTQTTPEKTTAAVSTRVTTSFMSTTFTTTSPSCGTNMVYMNCTCQTTCEDPRRLNGCFNNCAGLETCICPDGFYLMGEECVLAEECGCYFADEDIIIQEGDTQLFSNCIQQCACSSGVLSCDAYQCNSDASCQNQSSGFQCYCNNGYYGDGVSSCTPLNDCQDVFDNVAQDEDVYTIVPTDSMPFQVYCKDGWTVFQRRTDGSVDFRRNWEEYKLGFGDLRNNVWLGLMNLYYLTNSKFFKLRISLVHNSSPFDINYSLFRIDTEANNYGLKELGSFTGHVAPFDHDFLRVHFTYPFSTFDQDHDAHPSVNCANDGNGGWWYKQCWESNLNGVFGTSNANGGLVLYDSVNMIEYPITFCEMSVKPA